MYENKLAADYNLARNIYLCLFGSSRIKRSTKCCCLFCFFFSFFFFIFYFTILPVRYWFPIVHIPFSWCHRVSWFDPPLIAFLPANVSHWSDPNRKELNKAPAIFSVLTKHGSKIAFATSEPIEEMEYTPYWIFHSCR